MFIRKVVSFFEGGDSVYRFLCFIVVDGYRSILDAYDAGREAI